MKRLRVTIPRSYRRVQKPLTRGHGRLAQCRAGIDNMAIQGGGFRRWWNLDYDYDRCCRPLGHADWHILGTGAAISDKNEWVEPYFDALDEAIAADGGIFTSGRWVPGSTWEEVCDNQIKQRESQERP